uniref:Coat protein n=1 Tax=Plasmopara viticola lesion associated Partiti-like 2 TaxID=2689984 RepID=A0A6B9KHV0_9VIRU|nr:coat protein [Plasmopara viticola lesion associated Partiti-like 2]
MSSTTAHSVAPSDSISQVQPVESVTTAPSAARTKGRPPRRSPKSAIDKTAPSGAVEVAPAGQNRSTKSSQVVSSTVPLTGWGEIDLSDHRKDIQPTFTVDAAPFSDLVDTTYALMQSRYSASAKHIPRALFRYYCFTAYHMRTLHLHKSNANVLVTEEKNALNILTSGEEFQIPAPIAQYLANMGNFQQGGETFYFRQQDVSFEGVWKGGNVEEGWVSLPDDSIVVDSPSSFWAYAQTPVPGVYTLAVQQEIDSIANGTPPTLDHISPKKDGHVVVPTANIIGYSPVPYVQHHASWRSTYSALGWTDTSLPSDVQTYYNLSTSTLKWVSEKLATIRDFKLHSSKQLTLSVMGNPIQAYWLDVSHPTESKVNSVDQTNFDPRRRGFNNLSLMLDSRFGMDNRLLAPAFAFGYRAKRTKAFHGYSATKEPVYFGYSPFDPWQYFDNDGKMQNPPPLYWNEANTPFTYGSAPFINVPRFGTHGLVRSVGLDAALIFSSERS